jgi:hypothetical protein
MENVSSLIVRIVKDFKAEAADCIVNARIVVGQFLGVEDMITIYPIREIVI